MSKKENLDEPRFEIVNESLLVDVRVFPPSGGVVWIEDGEYRAKSTGPFIIKITDKPTDLNKE